MPYLIDPVLQDQTHHQTTDGQHCDSDQPQVFTLYFRSTRQTDIENLVQVMHQFDEADGGKGSA